MPVGMQTDRRQQTVRQSYHTDQGDTNDDRQSNSFRSITIYSIQNKQHTSRVEETWTMTRIEDKKAKDRKEGGYSVLLKQLQFDVATLYSQQETRREESVFDDSDSHDDIFRSIL
jgi:NAD(P)H-nitrite reductase large subunit